MPPHGDPRGARQAAAASANQRAAAAETVSYHADENRGDNAVAERNWKIALMHYLAAIQGRRDVMTYFVNKGQGDRGHEFKIRCLEQNIVNCKAMINQEAIAAAKAKK